MANLKEDLSKIKISDIVEISKNISAETLQEKLKLDYEKAQKLFALLSLSNSIIKNESSFELVSIYKFLLCCDLVEQD